MKKFQFILIIVVLFFMQHISAQEKEQKLHFYGGFGLSFDGNGFQFSIQPGLIYDVSHHVKAGAGVQYAYGSSSNKLVGGSYSYNILGYNLLALGYPVKEVELSGEFEDLYITQKFNNGTDKYWSPALFAGVGYKYKNFAIGFKYNFLHKEGRSIYNDAFIPYVRIYF